MQICWRAKNVMATFVSTMGFQPTFIEPCFSWAFLFKRSHLVSKVSSVLCSLQQPTCVQYFHPHIWRCMSCITWQPNSITVSHLIYICSHVAFYLLPICKSVVVVKILYVASIGDFQYVTFKMVSSSCRARASVVAASSPLTFQRSTNRVNEIFKEMKWKQEWKLWRCSSCKKTSVSDNSN